MLGIAKMALVGGLTALITGGLAWLIGRARPRILTEYGGTIVPEKWSAVFTVLFGVLFIGAGVVAIIFDEALIGAGAIIGGAVIAGFMAPSLTNVHAVTWNADYVEGPSKTFGPTLGLARTRIMWKDIVNNGKTNTNYWYIESSNGEKIYWSFLYSGFGEFVSNLRRRCPDLKLHPDLAD